ncbi:hypothetical protein ACFS07_10290 [Undibacterium arcticum]
MTALVANSAESLQSAIGELRDLWNQHKFLRISIKAGKDRSIPQNAITHVWYEQIARELREDNALGWKCYCKLHHGVPILRTEDDEFRGTYDAVIKPLSYEQKLIAMRCWPVTSLMTKEQLSKYAEAIQADFCAARCAPGVPGMRIHATETSIACFRGRVQTIASEQHAKKSCASCRRTRITRCRSYPDIPGCRRRPSAHDCTKCAN